MYKETVLKFFGNATEVTKLLCLRSSGTVSQWGEIIPEKQALKLEKLIDELGIHLRRLVQIDNIRAKDYTNLQYA